MSTKKLMQLVQYDDEPGAAYLQLQDHPHVNLPGNVKRTVDVHNLIDNYNGPGLFIDFNEDGIAIGIEILYGSSDEGA